MPSRIAALLILTLSLASFVACSKDGERESTPLSTPPLAESTAGGTPAPAATPCTRPDGTTIRCVSRAPATVWLIDARDGRLTTLFEDHQDAAWYAGFDASGTQAEIGVYSTTTNRMSEFIRYSLAGRELERQPWTGGFTQDQNAPACREIAGGAEVEGRFYAEANCGPISPDGRRMSYGVATGQALDGRRPDREQWAVDLATGSRHELQGELVTCLGDSFFGAEWSLSGRFLFFADCAEGGRIFLGDLAADTTRQIASRTPNLGARPDWSPVEDTLVYSSAGGSTVLEHLQDGSMTDLTDVAWPARFDPSGRYLYSPSSGTLSGQPDPRHETAVYDLEAGRVVATLPGTSPYQSLYLDFVPFVGLGNSFVAALQDTPDCNGTAVYANTRLVKCVQHAVGPAISPGGEIVALARKSGETGHTQFPGGASVSLDRYDILLVDVASGTERVIARDALAQNPYPLPAVWNQAGTHLLVRWPFAYAP